MDKATSQRPGRGPGHGPGPIALFAVASLLLTFFVALNAMSERDHTRVRAVADSFNHRMQAGPGPVAIVPIDGNIPAVKAVERQWQSLFPGAAMAEGPTFGTGNALHAELGIAGMFAPGRADPLASADGVLAALKRILIEMPDGVDLALDVKLSVGAEDEADGGRLALQRARALARLLGGIDHGGDVAVGLQRGRPGVIALELRLASRPVPARPIPTQPIASRPPAARPGA